ncbi:MAG: hypothetical protein NVS4B2_34700 [Chloroflexota bacterium]
MDFPIAVDREARVMLPDLDLQGLSVALSPSALVVRFSHRFDAQVELSAIESVQAIPDPRPGSFLPMGVSAAVNTLGSDTIAVLGSHDGLVQIDFREAVPAHVVAPDNAPGGGVRAADGTIGMRRLIVSLQEPGAFIEAFEAQRRGAGTPDAGAEAAEQPWPTGG